MRIYNPQIAKFLSVDPLYKDFPWNSSYAFAENDVIRNIDLDGMERLSYLYLPKFSLDDVAKVIDGTLQGLKQLAHDLAPIRPADENDPKTLSESWERIKNIPNNIKNIPANLIDVYENGTLEEKAKATVGVLGTVAILKGKGSKSPTMLKTIKAGYNVKTRILTFAQGTAKTGKITQMIKVPPGYEKVKVSGSKADVFKLKGKNTWITPDLDGHNGGMWKKANGKAENLFKKETREGTFNANLTKKVGS
jgi:hypothetical protein